MFPHALRYLLCDLLDFVVSNGKNESIISVLFTHTHVEPYLHMFVLFNLSLTWKWSHYVAKNVYKMPFNWMDALGIAFCGARIVTGWVYAPFNGAAKKLSIRKREKKTPYTFVQITFYQFTYSKFTYSKFTSLTRLTTAISCHYTFKGIVCKRCSISISICVLFS